MPSISGDDAPWLVKVTIGLISLLGGAFSATVVWVTKMNSRDEANRKRDERITLLEVDRDQIRLDKEVAKREQAAFCEKRWTLLQDHQKEALDQITKTICSSVKLMMKDVKADTSDEISKINVNIGILLDRTNPDEELKKMLKNLLDQRHGEIDRRHEP